MAYAKGKTWHWHLFYLKLMRALSVTMRLHYHRRLCLKCKNGFSPAQLVFARNTNLPNLDKLPVQENSTSPDIASHISALHAAQRAFVASESSNKLKLAMHKNIRKSGAAFNIGDEIFYKWDDKLAWKEPGCDLG